MSGEEFKASPASINGNAHLLVEIAGLLREGRLDQDTGAAARAPRVHAEVAAEVEQFTQYATDQYGDLVLLLTALSTALRTTASNYTEVDQRTMDDFRSVLDTSSYQAAGR